jgi:O-antigen/teichoic acid export membrane protein
VLVHVVVLMIWLQGDWEAMRMAAIASLLLGPAFIARDYGMAALQGAREFRWFNFARLSQLIFYIPLVLLLFLASWGGLTRQVLASVIAAVAMAAVAIGAAYRKRGEPDASSPGTSVREMLRFGQRSHFGRLMPVERFRADQLAVTLFLTPTALGLYAVATAFTNVLRFLTMAIGYVAFPAVAAEPDQARARATALRYVRIAIVISIVMVGILEVVGPYLINVLYGAEFRDAGRPLQWLLPGVGIVGIRRVLAESMRGGGNEAATSKAEVVTSIAFLALVYPLLKLWDLNGVAISITVAEAAGLVMLAWLLNRPKRAPNLDVSGGHA